MATVVTSVRGEGQYGPVRCLENNLMIHSENAKIFSSSDPLLGINPTATIPQKKKCVYTR